jgi:hypothetical protein
VDWPHVRSSIVDCGYNVKVAFEDELHAAWWRVLTRSLKDAFDKLVYDRQDIAGSETIEEPYRDPEIIAWCDSTTNGLVGLNLSSRKREGRISPRTQPLTTHADSNKPSTMTGLNMVHCLPAFGREVSVQSLAR